MKIFIGADHRGFDLKKNIVSYLEKKSYDVVDVGTDQPHESCDYPLIAFEVARRVVGHPNSRGILLCMSGIGHSIAANKVKGVYAALVYNKEAAALSRQHNNSNVLVLGAKFIDDKSMLEVVNIWLQTAFEGGRHERRTDMIKDYESTHMK